MPELPEVERGRRIAEAAALNKTITKVFAADDDIVYTGVEPKTFSRKLKNRAVRQVCRRGKYLWFILDQAPHPIFHFGMTGDFRTYTDPDDRHKYCKVEMLFDDGTYLGMKNPRRLGRIRLVDDPANSPPVSKLGFDPYLEMPNLKTFAELVRKRKAVMKGLLLNQAFAAGVGNWIADEILYQARIKPDRISTSLDDAEIKRMHQAMKKIITKAVDVDAEKKKFPKSWLFHHRWGKQANALTAKGEEIDFLTIAGRTTAWVPKVQV